MDEAVKEGWIGGYYTVLCGGMKRSACTSDCLPLLPVVWRAGAPISTAASLHWGQRVCLLHILFNLVALFF